LLTPRHNLLAGESTVGPHNDAHFAPKALPDGASDFPQRFHCATAGIALGVSQLRHERDVAAKAGNNRGRKGGNSSWRGPIWFPINYLIIEAFECYHHFYGDKLKVECPVGSGKMLTLQEVAQELSQGA
jgi:hypothetical protein